MIDWKEPKINFASIGNRVEISPEALGLSLLVKNILAADDGKISKFAQEGYSDKAFDQLIQKLNALGGREVYENNFSSGEDHLFVWKNAIVEVSSSKTKLVTINCLSANKEVTDACKEVATLFSAPTKRGYVFAITRASNGLHLTRIGYAGTAVEKNNYSVDVVNDYDYIIEDLKAPDPAGRIVILDGPPGTGKTYLIRGILMDVPNAMFVIVPPNMVSSMGGPELLPLLLKTREDYGKRGPTILILEDADQCLAPRHETDISSISTILNLGDGIFGSLFDIRIIATTNAKATDLDRAIVRKGRLSKRINIGFLPYKDANVILKRIVKDDSKNLPAPESADTSVGFSRGPAQQDKQKFSLADIYNYARECGWKPTPSQEAAPTVDVPGYFEDDEDYIG